jgi:hypothetical protein
MGAFTTQNVDSGSDITSQVCDNGKLAQIRLIERGADENDGLIIRNWTEFKKSVDKIDSYLKRNSLKTHEELSFEEINHVLNVLKSDF